MMTKPKLLVTIDTEPDDEWARRAEPATHNIAQVPGLQKLFDKYGVRPTYFVEYAVACDPQAAENLGRIHADGKCEIGAHLHAWNAPPHFEIPGEPRDSAPYLYQYPLRIQRAKFEAMHAQLARSFGFEPTSYRAGRYGLDADGIKLLQEFRYRVDSSVTPMVNWYASDRATVPGPDFRRAPAGVYELSEDDPCAAGRSGVIEVPVSVGYTRELPASVTRWLVRQRPDHIGVRILGRLLGVRKQWFRPRLDVSIDEMRSAARWLLTRNVGFINMMFHSSELIPNSQWCRTDAEVKQFVERIEAAVRLAIELGCEAGTTVGELGRERAEGQHGM